jgi:NNP family nitrate/nitrite transporter-like MFS transporter
MAREIHRVAPARQSTLQLTLATVFFAVSFTAWGLISAFASAFRTEWGLTSTETALLVAVPVLLGSIARVPMGMLADRFGGRLIGAVLTGVVAVPLLIIPSIASYRSLVVAAFLLGLAGSAFAVGIAFVSPWFAADRQGSALGVFGIGNIGQSIAVFGGPVLAARVGRPAVFYAVAIALLAWTVAFAVLARDAPARPARRTLGEMAAVFRHERLSWVLSAFYFLTFGGFVAFSIYLPTLLRDQFGLTATDAGFRTAGFVALATFARPAGGWMADRIGGSRVLAGVFAGIAVFALLLGWPRMLPFTVGSLGCAVLLGVGNGAVFRLVPEYFPGRTGTVTGLVGAMGGLGGFFPPLMLGAFRDRLGVIWPGFVLLSITALVMHRLNTVTFMRRQQAIEVTLPPVLRRAADRLRAGAFATMGTAILVAAIVVGSRNLQNFDTALVIYTFAVIFAAWGTIYHYTVWLQKPPTRVYWQRGWQLFRRGGALRATARLSSLTLRQLGAQSFIRERSLTRWITHQLIFWGCVLAMFVTFPLVFGWIHFRSLPSDQMTYVTYVFGFPAMRFHLGTAAAEIIFHALDISAVMVLGGLALALVRRMRDRGTEAVQTFAFDFFPIVLLFAISVTGLALTASQQWMAGRYYPFLAILHAITVVAALLFLPFGKFFHIVQRPAQLGVKLYQRAGAADEGTICRRCGQRFASRLHIADLEAVLPELGFDYRMSGTDAIWQELCPACKRKTLSTAQLRMRAAANHQGPTEF